MKLFIATIGIILGIIMGLYLKISIVFIFFIILIIYILLKEIRYKSKNVKRIFRYLKIFLNKKLILIFVLLTILSNIYIIYLEKDYDAKYKDINGKIKVIGTIVNNGIDKEYKKVYKVKIENINGNKKYKNTYLLLNVKKDRNKNIDLKYGNKIEIICEYERPNTQTNYGGFDYKQYLKTEKVYGIINSKISEIKIVNNNNIKGIFKIINNISNKIEENANILLEKEQASLLTGILIGKKDNLSEDIKESFRDSNLSHMLAVSGAHVSYVILGISIALDKLGKRKSNILTIILLIFFIFLTGASPSVIRACIMSIYILFSNLIHKKPNILASICISIIILLILNPYNILNIGFQLSYGGTIGIILFSKKITLWIDNIVNEKLKVNSNRKVIKILNNIKEMLVVTISANIVIFPIMAIQFNTISLTFFISNLLAGPILGIIIILGFILIIISFFSIKIVLIFSIILKILLQILIQIADFSAKLPFSKIYIKTPNLFYLFIYYIFLIYIIYKNKLGTKLNKLKLIFNKIITITIILILIIQIFKILPKDLKIHFVDVGQGDCMLITTPFNKNILIDGGGSETGFDVGEKVLLPYLLDRQINKIDYCIITHFDADHVAGILSIMKTMKFKNIIISKQGKDSENYREFLKLVKEKNINVILVKKGDDIKVEKDLKIEILWPREEQIQENILNNNSIISKICYRDFSILNTGDIEQIAEKDIIDTYKNTNKLKANILKVAHHGSKSSSIQEFIEEVKPQISLIGVGAKNTFGHPNQGVLERLNQKRKYDI